MVDYCNMEAIRALVTEVQGGYRKLAAMRPTDRIPMLSHTYDYCTPRDARVAGISGPWFYTAFKRFKIPEEDWIALSKSLLNQLADGILALQGEREDAIPNFHVVKTLGVLQMAELGTTGDSNDWLNEVHPNSKGYEKLGAEFTDTIKRLLGG